MSFPFLVHSLSFPYLLLYFSFFFYFLPILSFFTLSKCSPLPAPCLCSHATLLFLSAFLLTPPVCCFISLLFYIFLFSALFLFFSCPFLVFFLLITFLSSLPKFLPTQYYVGTYDILKTSFRNMSQRHLKYVVKTS